MFCRRFYPPSRTCLRPSLVMSILPLSNPANWRFCCEAWSLIALDLGACTSQLAALWAQLGAKHVLAVDAGSETTSPATAFAKLKRIRSTSPRPQQRSHDPGILLYNAVLQHSPKNCDSEKSDLIIGHHLRLLSWSREPRSALLGALFPSVGRYLLRGL